MIKIVNSYNEFYEIAKSQNNLREISLLSDVQKKVGEIINNVGYYVLSGQYEVVNRYIYL